MPAGVLRLGQEKKDDKVPKRTEAQEKYDRLAEKAHKGDAKAARELAKWCYTHDADNTRAKYWLGVAAQHGDSASARAAEYVQDWR